MMTRGIRAGSFGVASLMAMSSIGCGETRGPAARARIDTLPAGRIQVTNTGRSRWAPETAWRLEEDLRLGTAADDGPPEEQFERIFQLTTDSRGRMYVLDVVAGLVRVFEPDGSFAHTVGGPGQGPGELSQPVELSLAAGDTLWVADQGVGGYSIFGPDGAFARILRRPNFFSQIRGLALAAGRYLQWGFAFPDGGFGRVHLLPIRVGPTPEIADTFPPIEFTQRLMEGGRPAVFFSADPTGAVAPDGSIWFAHTGEYTVHSRTLEGDTTLTFTIPEEPHPLEDGDREWVVGQIEDQPPARRTAYLAALPEYRPMIDAIVPDGAGHVYVLVDVAGMSAGTALDVFEESGVYVGRLSLPRPVSDSSPILHATRDHLYMVVTDELDVQYVSRLRILR